jgi:hypothetical protein
VAHYSPKTAVTGRQEELYDLDWDPGEHRNLLLDRSQHPVRGDWNVQNLWQEWAEENPFDDYEKADLTRTLDIMRGHIAGIWIDGFLNVMGKSIEPNGNSVLDNRPDLLETISRLDPKQQLALVSNYFSVSKNPDASNRPPEFSIGYPCLPSSFLEFA